MITRNTIRADGQTVGEAMDRDAAFLRSVGIDAKDGTPTIDEQRDEFREKMRQVVLGAMDDFAESVTKDRNDGWRDQELPALFAAVDVIADRIFGKSLGLG